MQKNSLVFVCIKYCMHALIPVKITQCLSEIHIQPGVTQFFFLNLATLHRNKIIKKYFLGKKVSCYILFQIFLLNLHFCVYACVCVSSWIRILFVKFHLWISFFSQMPIQLKQFIEKKIFFLHYDATLGFIKFN